MGQSSSKIFAHTCLRKMGLSIKEVFPRHLSRMGELKENISTLLRKQGP